MIFREKKIYPAEEVSAGSSATTKCSLRKKVLQDLPRVRERQRSSAGSRGRSCRTFFRWITRNILQKLFPQESTEEPSTLLPREFPEAPFLRAEEGSSRGRTFVFNLQHHRKKLIRGNFTCLSCASSSSSTNTARTQIQPQRAQELSLDQKRKAEEALRDITFEISLSPA
ncbi:hypothetical protein HKD37_05G012914 [Glycine soja]